VAGRRRLGRLPEILQRNVHKPLKKVSSGSRFAEVMKLISNIVFTKNRPLQLNGYLESLYRYFPPEQIQTYVLWKQELFTQEYEQLFSRYPTCVVVRERDFSGDFFKILNQIETKYILFGIDDVVYFDSVEISLIDVAFEIAGDNIFGFSLRFGCNVLNNGKDKVAENEIESQKIYKLNWQSGQTKNTSYPFELCATIYRTELVKKIIHSSRSHNKSAIIFFSPDSVLIKGLRKLRMAGKAKRILKDFGFFYNPNALEDWVCKWCKENAENLPAYIYFKKASASAIQVNLVNIRKCGAAYENREHTVETLNEKYQKGWVLDIDFIAEHKPTDTHCGKENFKLIKK
jgi:hypothetical protein